MKAPARTDLYAIATCCTIESMSRINRVLFVVGAVLVVLSCSVDVFGVRSTVNGRTYDHFPSRRDLKRVEEADSRAAALARVESLRPRESGKPVSTGPSPKYRDTFAEATGMPGWRPFLWFLRLRGPMRVVGVAMVAWSLSSIGVCRTGKRNSVG